MVIIYEMLYVFCFFFHIFHQAFILKKNIKNENTCKCISMSNHKDFTAGGKIPLDEQYCAGGSCCWLPIMNHDTRNQQSGMWGQ